MFCRSGHTTSCEPFCQQGNYEQSLSLGTLNYKGQSASELCKKSVFDKPVRASRDRWGVDLPMSQMDMGMRLLTNNHSIIKDHSIKHSPRAPRQCGVEGGSDCGSCIKEVAKNPQL